jgi:hypothetical protein
MAEKMRQAEGADAFIIDMYIRVYLFLLSPPDVVLPCCHGEGELNNMFTCMRKHRKGASNDTHITFSHVFPTLWPEYSFCLSLFFIIYRQVLITNRE